MGKVLIDIVAGLFILGIGMLLGIHIEGKAMLSVSHCEAVRNHAAHWDADKD